MKEIKEPQLTNFIHECDDRGLWPGAFIEFIGGLAYWRTEYEPKPLPCPDPQPPLTDTEPQNG